MRLGHFCQKLLPLALVLIGAVASAQVQSILVSKANPLHQEMSLDRFTSIIADNSVGQISVYEVSGNTVVVDGEFDGDKNATVHIDHQIAESAVLSFKVEYSKDSGSVSTGGISIRNGVIIGNISGNFSFTGSGITIINGGSGSLKLRLGVPTSLLQNLSLTSRSGDQQIIGAFQNEYAKMRIATFESGSGSIHCEGLQSEGGISFTATSGDLAISHVSGPSQINTSSGRVELDANRGDLSVTTGSGDVSLNQQLATSLKIKTGSGEVEVSKSQGTLVIGTSSGDVKVDSSVNLAPTTVTTSSGEVSLKGISGESRVRTSSGDIYLADLVGDMKAKSSSGLISAKNSRGNAVFQTSSGDIRTADHHAGKIMAASRSGDVTFRNPDVEVIELSSTRGDIRGAKKLASGMNASCPNDLSHLLDF